jgi:hypothetical protein
LGSQANTERGAESLAEAAQKAREALAAVDLGPVGQSLALWADGDEEDLEANLYEGLGFPPLERLDLSGFEAPQH